MGLEITRLGIEEWITASKGEDERLKIPITLHSTSGSMDPFIRKDVDAAVVIPCDTNEIQVGDIVLINTDGRGAGVLLHRLYKVGNGKIITLGDNMLALDSAFGYDKLLGRVISITGPGKNIDCNCKWRRLQGKIIAHSYRIRPIIFFVRKVLRKIGRILRIKR